MCSDTTAHSPDSRLHRVALYPCCATDIAEPLELLRDYADEVVFCDPMASLRRDWRRIVATLPAGLPRPTFIVEDIRTALDKLGRVDVLFYRRDSEGEGGSGVFVLGDSFLPKLLQHFPREGGLIITDGSNSRGGNFKKMIKASGLTKHGWHFQKTLPDRLGGLHVISVSPVVVDHFPVSMSPRS